MDGDLHSARRALALRRGLGDVVGVGGRAVADHFHDRRRAAAYGDVEVFHHQHGGALADDKAVALGVEGPGRHLRVVIAGGQGLAGVKTRNADWAYRRLCAARKHGVDIALLQDLKRLAYGVSSAGACRNRGVVGAFRAKHYGDLAGRHIGQHHRHKEGADARGAALV